MVVPNIYSNQTCPYHSEFSGCSVKGIILMLLKFLRDHIAILSVIIIIIFIFAFFAKKFRFEKFRKTPHIITVETPTSNTNEDKNVGDTQNDDFKIETPTPKPNENEDKKDEDTQNIDLKIEIPVGLINRSSTCYMNAMMQALSSSSKLIEDLIGLNQLINKNDKLTLFIGILQAINEPLDNRRGVYNTTNKLVAFMNSVLWDRPSQQDAFQLLSFFINAIHKEIVEKVNIPPKFEILHAFTENSAFNKLQDHLALAVPLCGEYKNYPGVELESLFDAFFETSLIDDGPNATTMYMHDATPNVLIVHIQANEWSSEHGCYFKPKYYIRYKDTLEYSFKMAKTKDGSRIETVALRYELMAVVHHTGDINGGHYITYRKSGQQWFIANDEYVSMTSFKYDVVPYIMVYQKIGSD